MTLVENVQKVKITYGGVVSKFETTLVQNTKRSDFCWNIQRSKSAKIGTTYIFKIPKFELTLVQNAMRYKSPKRLSRYNIGQNSLKVKIK